MLIYQKVVITFRIENGCLGGLVSSIGSQKEIAMFEWSNHIILVKPTFWLVVSYFLNC